MKAAKKISPEDYILAVLSPQERLEAAFNVAREAFKDTTLKPADLRAAVQKVRKKVYAERQKKAASRH
jgi:DNA-binding IclR family transcriptional regulator